MKICTCCRLKSTLPLLPSNPQILFSLFPYPPLPNFPPPPLHTPNSTPLPGSKHLPFTFTEAGNITLLHGCQAHESLFLFFLPSANKKILHAEYRFSIAGREKNMRFVQLAFFLELIAGTASTYKREIPSSKTKTWQPNWKVRQQLVQMMAAACVMSSAQVICLCRSDCTSRQWRI